VNGWTVELDPAARKELRQLDDGPRQAAFDLLDDLRELGPALVSASELAANPDNWRVCFHLDHWRSMKR
jgi:hypothetical protein